jgi:hypothetical protein
VQEGLQRLGVEPSSTTPAQFSSLVRSERAKYGELVKQTGATAE